MLKPSSLEFIGALAFAAAILHTFSSKLFEYLAARYPRHKGFWHLTSEVEVAFGVWALVLVIVIMAMEGSNTMVRYITALSFTEPMFVFVAMVIAATRPILQTATSIVKTLGRALPFAGSIGFCLTVLIVLPLLGSLITEPAAMTLAALILSEHFYCKKISTKLKYATLGVLFVNVSIGGTLTPFAAPPVLMVASKWNWDFTFMITNFGWKAVIAVVLNSVLLVAIFQKELQKLETSETKPQTHIPPFLILTHLAFLIGVVVYSHHPAIFLGLFMFFVGISQAYPNFQDKLIIREALFVAFFLSGLVVLGGQQQWWLKHVLLNMNVDTVFFTAIALTAFTDNAALTYLGSMVEGLSDGFKYALVAGAVAGGGLTVIANAPNLGGVALLRGYFKNQRVHPLGLFLAATPPTAIAALAYKYL
jgi:Na+/H+ antiporter NhaD/arsenite permease-like protein